MQQRDRNSAQTVEKAMRILRVVGASDLPLGSRRLAEATGYSVTSVQRLLKALEKEGALTRVGSKVTIGWMIRGLTGGLEWHDELKAIAAPTMITLRGLCGRETVGLYVRVGTAEFICIETMASNQAGLTHVEPLYQPIQMTGGATSKVFLAQRLTMFGRPALENHLVEMMGFDRDDRRALDRAVDDIAATGAAGFSVSRGERFEGMTAISVPIKNQRGQTVAALTVAGLSQRFTPAAVTDWTSHCVAAARQIRRNYLTVDRGTSGR